MQAEVVNCVQTGDILYTRSSAAAGNATDQGVAIHDGDRSSFSVAELATSTAIGGVAGGALSKLTSSASRYLSKWSQRPLPSTAASPTAPKTVRNPYGSKGKPDHQAKVKELVDKAHSEAMPGEFVLAESRVQGFPGLRRNPDSQIVGTSGKTRKVFEAERKPHSRYHQKRIKDYDKNGIEHETHSLKSDCTK